MGQFNPKYLPSLLGQSNKNEKSGWNINKADRSGVTGMVATP